MDSVGPEQLVVLRFVPTLIFFIPIIFLFSRRQLRELSWRDRGWLLVLGIFGVGVYNISLNTGQTYIPASLAALVIALNPASIAIFSAIVIKEKPPLRTWLGLAISFLGITVVLLARGEMGKIDWRMLIGVLITLGAPVSWGVFTTGLRHFSQRYGAFLPVALAMTYATLPLLFAPLFDPSLITISLHANPSLIWSVLFLAIACTVYGFSGWALVLKRVEAAKAGSFIYLVPLVAAFGSRWILDEPLDLPLLFGALLVLAGVWTATGRKTQFLSALVKYRSENNSC